MTPVGKDAHGVRGRWIRITEISTDDGLTTAQRANLLARAMTDLALAQSLVLIHGPERGLARYAETGGVVRPGDDGETVIWSEN